MELVQKGWSTGELVVSMNRGRLTRSVLLVINLVLLLTIGLLWRNAPQPDTGVAVSSANPSSLPFPASPLRRLSLENYQELLARPLFWSERRPLESVVPSEAGAGQQPLSFVLIGVVVSPESSHALLSKPGSGDVAKVQPGDVVEGWQVETLTADSVTLTRGGEKRQIYLDEERTKSR